MVRLVGFLSLIFVLSLTLTACRGGTTNGQVKSTLHVDTAPTPSPDTAPSQSTTAESSASAASNPVLPATPLDPKKENFSPAAQAQYLEMLSAATQFKKMLDVRAEGSNPMRMQGMIITNKTPNISFLNEKNEWVFNEPLLFGLINERKATAGFQVTPKDKAFEQLKEIAASKNMKLLDDLKIKMLTTGNDSEAIRALDNITKKPREYASIRFPVSLMITPNLDDANAPTVLRNFYAVLNIQNAKFDGFNLVDSDYRPVGRIIMPLADPNKTEDQRLLIYFKDTNGFINVEQLAILQMIKVTCAEKCEPAPAK